ncbi:hypothetical protein ACFO8Q_01930 [Effusibacillus consociatus]|uniref:Uncharacterized protein n=1 Tax=Effusibacillus consociatus TaxID=1117041 RepID=A0ABV9PX03_9BACL
MTRNSLYLLSNVPLSEKNPVQDVSSAANRFGQSVVLLWDGTGVLHASRVTVTIHRIMKSTGL